MIDYDFSEAFYDTLGEELTFNGVRCDVHHSYNNDYVYIGKILCCEDGSFSPTKIVKYTKELADLDPVFKGQELLVYGILSKIKRI